MNFRQGGKGEYHAIRAIVFICKAQQVRGLFDDSGLRSAVIQPPPTMI